MFLGRETSTDAANNTALDLLHKDWATLFLGMDHGRGVISWQAKDTCASPTGCTGNGILNVNGEPNLAFEAWKALGKVAKKEWAFLREGHASVNAHRFRVAD